MSRELLTYWKLLVELSETAVQSLPTLFNSDTSRSFIRTLGGRSDFAFSPVSLSCTKTFYDLLRKHVDHTVYIGRKFPFRDLRSGAIVNLRFRRYGSSLLLLEVERRLASVPVERDLIALTNIWEDQHLSRLILAVVGLISQPAKSFTPATNRPKAYCCMRVTADSAALPTQTELVEILTRHRQPSAMMAKEVLRKNEKLQSDATTLLVDRQGVIACIPKHLSTDQTVNRRYIAASNMLELVACVERMIETNTIHTLTQQELTDLSAYFLNPEVRFVHSTSSKHIWQLLASEFGLSSNAWARTARPPAKLKASQPCAIHVGWRRWTYSRRFLFPAIVLLCSWITWVLLKLTIMQTPPDYRLSPEIQEARQSNSTKSRWVWRGEHSTHETAIVFVHGIFGDTLNTWRNATSGKRFYDLLATDPKFRDKVDIFVYGFPSTMVGGAGSFDIQEAASDLQAQLQYQEITNYRRIVFVAHSMGGLVVIRALLNDRRLLLKVPLVMFLATPQEGAAITILAKELIRNPALAEMLPGDANAYLHSMTEDWHAIDPSKRPHIACAYEKLPVVGVGIVSRLSATRLCDSQSQPVEANHIGIAKPADRDSGAYVALSNALTTYASTSP